MHAQMHRGKVIRLVLMVVVAFIRYVELEKNASMKSVLGLIFWSSPLYG